VLRLGPAVLHGFRRSLHPRLRVLIVPIARALAAPTVLGSILWRLLVLGLLELGLLMLLRLSLLRLLMLLWLRLLLLLVLRLLELRLLMLLWLLLWRLLVLRLLELRLLMLLWLLLRLLVLRLLVLRRLALRWLALLRRFLPWRVSVLIAPTAILLVIVGQRLAGAESKQQDKAGR
jgi:hypothetical protein